MQLVKYDAACRAIAEANSVDEVKDIRDKAQAIQAYAKQAKNKTLEIDASEIRIRAERQMGIMLRDTDIRAKPGDYRKESSPPTLSDLGITKDLSSRAQQMASIPDDEFEATLAEHREEQKAVTGRTMERLVKGAHQHITSSESVEWYTPALYVDAAREVMGRIDLDPASNDEANEIVKAGTYYTEEMDGLSQEWFGNVWLNPPYGSACRAFIERTITLKIEGRIDQAVILVNANSNDTGWFRPLWDHLLCFTYGRVNFYGPNGQESGPTHGSCFVYLGDRAEEFKRVFSKIGAVVKRA